MTIAEQTLADFGGLTVVYDADVLRPRPWTIAQSSWCADLLRTAPEGPVLELCAGVGHIGLAAVADGRRELVLVDVNPVACALARRNVEAAAMHARAEVREGAMDEVLGAAERFALIIADPPWVLSDEVGQFPDDPRIAIDGGEDGLELARMCCTFIEAHLIDEGSAVLQLGSTEQAASIGAYLAETSTLRVREVREYADGTLVRLTR